MNKKAKQAVGAAIIMPLLILLMVAIAIGGGGSENAPTGCGDVSPASLDRGVGTPGPGTGVFSVAQREFAESMADGTGLNVNVVFAWMANEQPPGSASAPNGRNNWLNVGSTNTAFIGGGNPAWRNPVSAGEETSTWLHGHAIYDYGPPAASIVAILKTAGESPATQIHAIQTSGWSTAGEPDMPALYREFTGSNGGSVEPVSNPSPGSGSSSSPGGVSVNTAAADKYVGSLPNGGQVGWAVVSSTGQVLGSHNATMHVHSASITKSMLLVAYLNGHPGGLSAQTQGILTGMIEDSDNGDADWVWDNLAGSDAGRVSAVEAVARKAGMTGFVINTSDPLYVLGESQITAMDFARFFSQINTLIGSAHQTFAMGLLSSISSADTWGVLSAGLSGITASKAGWGNWGAPAWTVNQAAQITAGGQTVGLAITTQGDASLATGETILQTLARDAISESEGSGTGAGCSSTTVHGIPDVSTVPGYRVIIGANGVAHPPASAPQAVKNIVDAADATIHYPYCWGGGHSTFEPSGGIGGDPNGADDCAGTGRIGFDCSGSVSFALHGGGGGVPDSELPGPLGSGSFESWAAGPGKWVTIYANAGHVYMQVAGAWFNTENSVALGVNSPPEPATAGGRPFLETGPRWSSGNHIVDYPQPGFVVVHPTGL